MDHEEQAVLLDSSRSISFRSLRSKTNWRLASNFPAVAEVDVMADGKSEDAVDKIFAIMILVLTTDHLR